MQLYGEAVYEGKPYGGRGMGGNFVLKGDGCLYLFFHNVMREGHKNVTTRQIDGWCGAYAFENVVDEIASIEWMDNHENLTFTQTDSILTLNATGFPYGTATCVRVAKAILK